MYITSIINNLIKLITLYIRFFYVIYYIAIKSKNQICIASIFYTSIKFYYTDVIDAMLKKGIDPNIPFPLSENSYVNPLICAIECDNHEAMLSLIRYGADVNTYSNYLMITPLYISVLHGCPKCVEILLYYGANINVVTYKIVTPIELASRICYNNLTFMVYDRTITNIPKKINDNFEIMKILVSHFLLQSSNDRLNNRHQKYFSEGYNKNKLLVSMSVILTYFKKQCIKDINVMKNIKLGDESFLDILVERNTIKLSTYMSNQDILDIPKSVKVYNTRVNMLLDDAIMYNNNIE
nr:CPPV301 ankyrin repeat protein [Cooks petrelpox virus]